MPDLLLISSILSGLVWATFGLLGLRGLRRVPALEPLDRPPTGRVAVVVATRDDGEAVGATVDRLLAQRDVDLRVVVVDDRSTDATAAVLAARRSAPGLEVVRIAELPDGWLGKCHACWVGAGRVPDADWLLFVDADSRLEPDVVAAALRVAERSGAAHVCLIPQLDGQTFAGRTVTLAMCVGLLHQAAGVEADRAGAYMGVGAFNLVRRDAYFGIGGHERLRLEVVEDVALGRGLRAAGHRARVRFAVDGFQVRWITSLGSVFRVLEKNYFAIFGFRTLRFSIVWLSGAATWALAWTSWPGLLGLVVLAASTVPVARRYGWRPWLHAALVPLAIPVILAAMAHSAVRTLSRGGVAWRGTFYPLAQLRAGRAR